MGASPPLGIGDARELVHGALWGSIASISTKPETKGFPFNNIVSFADGTMDASTGIPYLLVSPLDESISDLLIDPRISLSLTGTQLEDGKMYQNCSIADGGDPESPPCTRLTLTGTFKNITGTSEAQIAEAALYSRHPLMKDWGPGNPHSLHDFFFAKIELKQVWLIDHYGGAARLPVKDYLAYKF